MEDGEEVSDCLLFFQSMDAVGQESGAAGADDTSASETEPRTSGHAGAGCGGGGLDWLINAFKDPRTVLPGGNGVPDMSQLLAWSQASSNRLARVERLIMNRARRPHEARFVPVHTSTRRPDPYTGQMLLSLDLHRLWTVRFPYNRGPSLPPATPLVLLHGFGVGSAFFCMNLDNLAIGREVIAVDLPGFGRSSRPDFPKDPSKIESVFTEMLEQWRRAMGINSFILLGHSFGGYVAACYAFGYPERVEHLILADPWGLEAYPHGINWHKPIPAWIRSHHDWEWTHAGGFLRACGPLGPLAVRGFSHYICKRFYRFLGGDAWAAADYVYQCNAVESSKTEEAIFNLSRKIMWARNPVMPKLASLPLDTFVTFIYGEESWLDSSVAENYLESRVPGTAEVHVIPGVGHDSYAEDPPAFNQTVNAVCSWVDTRRQLTRRFVVPAAPPGSHLHGRRPACNSFPAAAAAAAAAAGRPPSSMAADLVYDMPATSALTSAEIAATAAARRAEVRQGRRNGSSCGAGRVNARVIVDGRLRNSRMSR